MVQILWKTVWQLFIKLSIHLPDNPTIPLIAIFKRERNICLHKHLYMNVYSIFIHNIKKRNNPCPSVKEYYSEIEKNKLPLNPIIQTNLQSIMVSERN